MWFTQIMCDANKQSKMMVDDGRYSHFKLCQHSFFYVYLVLNNLLTWFTFLDWTQIYLFLMLFSRITPGKFEVINGKVISLNKCFHPISATVIFIYCTPFHCNLLVRIYMDMCPTKGKPKKSYSAPPLFLVSYL